MSNDQVASRLKFMGIGNDQRATLVAIKPILASLIGRGLDRFYTSARATPKTAAFFRNEAHMEKAKAAQEKTLAADRKRQFRR